MGSRSRRCCGKTRLSSSAQDTFYTTPDHKPAEREGDFWKGNINGIWSEIFLLNSKPQPPFLLRGVRIWVFWDMQTEHRLLGYQSPVTTALLFCYFLVNRVGKRSCWTRQDATYSFCFASVNEALKCHILMSWSCFFPLNTGIFGRIWSYSFILLEGYSILWAPKCVLLIIDRKFGFNFLTYMYLGT
jgi:hypothetical protein